MNMTYQDFLKYTADIYHPKTKKRLEDEEKRQIAKPYIEYYIQENKGREGDHVSNIASQSWWKYKKELK